MDDPTFELLVGDVREQLRGLEPDSVQMVVTSPPYWLLREYGTEPQHWGDWVGELGQEPSHLMFVEHLVAVFREVKRVLRPDGVLFVNLDDSYAGTRGGRDWEMQPGDALGSMGRGAMKGGNGLKPKDMALVPQRFTIAMQDDGWWVRCDGVWSKPNAMPSAVNDRPARSHESMLMFTKSGSYYWDAEAVREPLADGGVWELEGGWRMLRNMRSVWTITTENYADAHFAVMAKAVVERAVKAATSDRGCCSGCGAPIERVVERRSVDRHELPREHPEWRPGRYDDGKAGSEQSPGAGQRFVFTRTTGWRPGCACALMHEVPPPRPCVVLDPFGGALTTAVVSRRLGRSSVSIELSPEFAEQGRRRMETWWKDVSAQRGGPDASQLQMDAV